MPMLTQWRIARARFSLSRVISAISASRESNRPSAIRISTPKPLASMARKTRRAAMASNEILSFDVATLSEHLRAKKKAESVIASGNWRGTFHGVPIGLKDLVYTKGIRTTAGSKILGDFRPDYDATSWARLKEQGAVMLGKLNLHEFAYGITSSNPHWGVCRNPYALDRIPGGSSGGSAAAIVARNAPVPIGTHTGGLIRNPPLPLGW